MRGFEALRDRVILVTGAGSGLGAALCARLVEEGACVAALDLHAEHVDTLAERLRGDGGRVRAYTGDVGNAQDDARVLAAAVSAFGHLDAIVNCAGVDITAPIRDVDVAGWERVVRTNLIGPFLLSKLALEHLGASGHIVNVVSTAARRAWPNASAYHASKWGLMGLTQALHAELRPCGIKVSAIIAGGMRTPFLLDRFPDIDVGTLQDPTHVARAILFALTQPEESVVPEIMVLPMKETSWP